MKVHLKEIAGELETMGQSSFSCLDRNTGEIMIWYEEWDMTSEEKEEVDERLERGEICILPDQYAINDYEIMREFAETLPAAKRDKLLYALQGKGAFRRFKDGVIFLDVDQQWYAFKSQAYQEIVKRWCDRNGIEYEE